MTTCRLIIEDEVNIKLEGLPVDVRRKLANALKFEVPYARYMPQYKLGRWDGKVAFFGIGGTGYVNHLDVISNVLNQQGVEIIDIEDNRHKIDLNFEKIKEDYWGDKTWPKGHPAEGEPIRLRDYQVEVINNFLELLIPVKSECNDFTASYCSVLPMSCGKLPESELLSI